MKRIRGQEIIESVKVGDAENWDMRSLRRQVDAGYRRFLARRGLPLPFGMKAEVDAGFAAAKAEKRERKEANES